MTKAWVEFIGYQHFSNKGGWKALYRLYTEPPTIRDGTTVTQATLEKLGIEIPTIPKFVPDDYRRKPMWIFKCSCGLVDVDKVAMMKHIRETRNHIYSMEQINESDPIIEDEPKKVIFLNRNVEQITQEETPEEWATRIRKEFGLSPKDN